MIEFFEVLGTPAGAFLQRALLLGLLASVAAGVVGTFVVARRIGYMAAAVSHSVLGGVGAALYLERVHGWAWVSPLSGAMVAAVLSAFLVGWINRQWKQREDTLLGALWVSGMCVGLLFLARTPGYSDLNAYLFGSILIVSPADIWRLAALDLLLLAFVAWQWRSLQALCFDEEYAALRGVRTTLLYTALLGLTAITVVLLMSVVGIILTIGVLTLPAAVAGALSRSLGGMLAGAVALGALFTVLGLALSYHFDLPSGPMIVLPAALAYLATVFLVKR